MVQHGARWCNMVQHGATWCNIVQQVLAFVFCLRLLAFILKFLIAAKVQSIQFMILCVLKAHDFSSFVGKNITSFSVWVLLASNIWANKGSQCIVSKYIFDCFPKRLISFDLAFDLQIASHPLAAILLPSAAPLTCFFFPSYCTATALVSSTYFSFVDMFLHISPNALQPMSFGLFNLFDPPPPPPRPKRLPQVFASPRQWTDHWRHFENGRQALVNLPSCHTIWYFQGGRSWQPFGEGKNGQKPFRQACICYFRDKCVVFARSCKFANL